MTPSSPTATGPGTSKTFADFGIDPDIVAALADAGITSPFPIQELALPLALSGADVIGQARTGTGKTVAFGVPLLQRIDLERHSVQGLVVVPTRELCVQVADDLSKASSRKGVQVVAVYGGKAIDPQAEAVAAGAHLVVGTPGRLLDLRRRGLLDLSGVAGLVLDEADEMLDLGFLPDVEQLIEACREQRQTLLFSATMPSAVVSLARRYMHKPTFLRADVEEVRIGPETQQYFFSCHRMDKPAVLARILQAPGRGLCVVFTRTKRMADTLTEELRERGVAAAPIHSDLRQEARERALSRFRDGKIDVLVATEVAARGLDITDVTHVVNYDCPDDERMYLHRIGRTGRAGAAGVAVTLAVWNELARLEMIKRALDVEAETHEVFSTSPILDELFDLPPREQPAHRKERPAKEQPPKERPAKERPAKESAREGRKRGRKQGRQISPREDERAPQPTTGDAPSAQKPGQTESPVEAATGARRTRVRQRSDRGSRPVPVDAGRPQPEVVPGEAHHAAPAGAEKEASRSRSDTTARAEHGGDGAGGGRTEPKRERGRAGRRGGRGRRGRSDRQRRLEHVPARSERISGEDARGDGKPSLHRPLVITHLP